MTRISNFLGLHFFRIISFDKYVQDDVCVCVCVGVAIEYVKTLYDLLRTLIAHSQQFVNIKKRSGRLMIFLQDIKIFFFDDKIIYNQVRVRLVSTGLHPALIAAGKKTIDFLTRPGDQRR